MPAGVGVLAGMLVSKMYSHHVHMLQADKTLLLQRTTHLEEQVAELTKQTAHAQNRVDIDMSEALAKLATATAAATTAAATAASACAYPQHPQAQAFQQLTGAAGGYNQGGTMGGAGGTVAFAGRGEANSSNNRAVAGQLQDVGQLQDYAIDSAGQYQQIHQKGNGWLPRFPPNKRQGN